MEKGIQDRSGLRHPIIHTRILFLQQTKGRKLQITHSAGTSAELCNRRPIDEHKRKQMGVQKQ